MLNFLKNTRKFINTTEALCIVLGNESCDLDSACSALCLAYYLEAGRSLKHIKAKHFLPVLNIPRDDYPLKTEVKYLLQKYEIPEAVLTFRDELQEDLLARSEFILVDHHMSPFTSQCVAVYDHRPRDTTVAFPNDCLVNIELVGSCATLITEVILNQDAGNHIRDIYGFALNLLRDTILLDTVNFSPSAGRFKKKDVMMCVYSECILTKLPHYEERENIFQQLCKARADVNALTAAQLLRKDLKILRNASRSISIALPGFPIQVQQFLKKDDVEKALNDFASNQECQLVLLLGMFVRDDNNVERDIGLISFNENTSLRPLIEARLLDSEDPSLNLELYKNCDFMGGRYYKQNNIQATRKHILPIVKRTIDDVQAE